MACRGAPRRPFFSLIRNVAEVWRAKRELQTAEKELVSELQPSRMAERERTIRQKVRTFVEQKEAEMGRLQKFDDQVNAELAKETRRLRALSRPRTSFQSLLSSGWSFLLSRHTHKYSNISQVRILIVC